MSLRDRVMAAIKKHKTNYSKVSKVAPRRETSGKHVQESDTKLTNETGESGDEYSDPSAYAKRHRDHIKNKVKNQSGKVHGKHPGFKAVQGKIQAEGYSHKVAGAILAARSRGASAAAHKANPHLNRVKG